MTRPLSCRLPPILLQLCLGDWKKYSCGFWAPNCKDLRESEEAALHMVCERAQINGQAP